MVNIKGIIFDMDGVLIDAKDWHYEALNKALNLFGMAIPRYDHLVTYDGLPTKQKLEMLSLEKGLPRGLHKFINKMKQQYTQELIQMHCKPNFKHEYALSRLKQENYKMVVCSNSIRNTVEVMLEKAHIIMYFDFFLSNEDVVKSKPNPEMYISAINRMGLSPQECLVLEDNDNGIKAAIASNAHLLKINSVSDVNYSNIRDKIKELESN
jgi:beta-phosphoglucomutase